MATEPSKEFYSISDPEAQHTYVGVRRAGQWAGFFLPHLRPGFSLLDCGCGVGSITLNLAEQVAPGQVAGIDVDDGQLTVAHQWALERGLSNVSFQHGNVYDCQARFGAQGNDRENEFQTSRISADRAKEWNNELKRPQRHCKVQFPDVYVCIQKFQRTTLGGAA